MSFASQALTHRSFRRRHLVGLVIVMTLFLWGILWGVAASHFNKTLNLWMDANEKEGGQVTFTNRMTDGSPWTIHIHLDSFEAKLPGGDRLKADEAILYLSVLDWNLFSSKLKGNIEGQIKGLPFKASTFKYGLLRPSSAPVNDTETGLFVRLHTHLLSPQVQEPFALGATIDEIILEARVMGTPPDFTQSDSVKAWNEASGVIEIDHLGLTWGPMTLSAKGTVALTPELQPEGAFSGRVDGLKDSLDLVLAKSSLSHKEETLLRSSVSVLARPAGMVGESSPIVPISLQGGGLYLGPVRLATLPTLVWP